MVSEHLKHIAVLALLAVIAYPVPQAQQALAEGSTFTTTRTTVFSCPPGYVCLRENDVAGLGRAYNAAQSHSGRTASTTANFTLTLTSQKQAETWAKGTRHNITWTVNQGIQGSVRVFLVTSFNAGDTGGKPLKIEITAKTSFAKGTATTKLKQFDNVNEGNYHVLVEFIGNGQQKTSVNATSVGVVTVTKHGPPILNITAPTKGTQWKKGSTQRVTWVANFIAEGKTKGDPVYSDVRFVPLYGIDKSQKLANAPDLSDSDKSILTSLSTGDIHAISKLSPSQLGDLDPANIATIPGLSPAGISSLSKLSPPGLDSLQQIDVLGLGDFTHDLILKPLQFMSSLDPVSNAISGLFGDDKPDTVKANLYLVDSTGKEKLLKKTYIEKAKSNISLDEVAPGTYTLKLVAKLKKTDVTAVSNSFTVVTAASSTAAHN